MEFDALDYWDRDYEGRLARQQTPEKLMFCRKAISAARGELERLVSAFPPLAVEEAEQYYRAYSDTWG